MQTRQGLQEPPAPSAQPAQLRSHLSTRRQLPPCCPARHVPAPRPPVPRPWGHPASQARSPDLRSLPGTLPGWPPLLTWTSTERPPPPPRSSPLLLPPGPLNSSAVQYHRGLLNFQLINPRIHEIRRYFKFSSSAALATFPGLGSHMLATNVGRCRQRTVPSPHTFYWTALLLPLFYRLPNIYHYLNLYSLT